MPGVEDLLVSQNSPPASADFEQLATRSRNARLIKSRERRRRRQRQALIAAGAAAMTALLAVLVIVQYGLGRNDASSTSGAAGGQLIGAAAAKPSPSATPTATPKPTPKGSPGAKARAMYGKPVSGLTWHSGIWPSGRVTTARMNAAGAWRGRTMDFATVYPAYGTWNEIAHSTWAVTDLRGYRGRVSYGMPLLPKNRAGKWEDILDGSHDHVFRGIATLLVANNHPDAAIRMGVEANGDWFPWAVTADTADEYRASFIRIRRIMREVSPDFTFWVDLNYGNRIGGSTDRMAPLTALYPGDAYVDGISMDHYDRNRLPALDVASWNKAISPPWAAGLAEAVQFAREHGKGFAVPEWGLDGVHGPGDNAYFIQKMFDFFTENSDVLVYENYFSESKPYIKGGLFDTAQNPKAARAYLSLWGRPKK